MLPASRWWLLLAAVPALGQGLRFGIKAGVPLTAYYQTGQIALPASFDEYSAATRRYTAGPTAEYRFGRHWGAEADVLFKRQGYVRINRSGSRQLAYDIKGDSWDVPLLAKYRFARWYVAGGLALRYVGPVRAIGESFEATRTPIDTTDPVELKQRWYSGVVAAGGLELGRGRLRLDPEIRYTRWVQNIGGVADHLLRFAPNQAELLVGVLF